ncbi:carbohydrate-selective porin OprB [Sphingomonas sp. BK069]|nr:carbohydrate-selective porin OprB [Sphingomonas sp. BK069]
MDPTNGFRLALSSGSGVLVPIEAAWTPVLGGDRPGYHKIGGWIETSRAQDLVRDDAGQLTIVSGQPGQSFRGRHGVYFEMSQQLTASPEGLDRKGLSMFFNFTQLDRRSSLIDNQTALGFTQTGTFASRRNDQVALALVRTHINDRTRETDRIALANGSIDGVRQAEWILEADYRLVATTGVKIVLDVQFGFNPGGISERRNVVALGMKSSVSF